MKFHGNLTLETFWLNWFGPFGRDLGTRKDGRFYRTWTDNPNDLLDFIKMCAEEKEEGKLCRRCYISSQPMRYIRDDGKRKVGEACAIEKLFFDFDDDTKYCPLCNIYIKKDFKLTSTKTKRKGIITKKTFLEVEDEFGNKMKIRKEDLKFLKQKKRKGSLCPKCGTICHEEPRLSIVGDEVKKFVKDIPEEVFIVGTRKGYHVYIFLRSIFKFNPDKFKIAKEIYELLQKNYNTDNYEFVDQRIIGDLMRFARVPMTTHEHTGAICQVLDRKLKPTKIRSLEFYKTYGITENQVKEAIEIIKKRRREKQEKEEQTIKEIENGYFNGNGNGSFHGIIRPCFQERMDLGEMSHDQRLAWISEIYHAGYNTPEKMLELCKCFNDFNERISMTQIKDYFKHERWEWKPYRCKTIKEKGWCLEDGDQCPIWKKGHNKDYKHEHQ